MVFGLNVLRQVRLWCHVTADVRAGRVGIKVRVTQLGWLFTTRFGMEAHHREILIKNRVFLVNHLRITPTLCDHLLSSHVLTQATLEEVNCCRYATNREKVRYVLDTLPSRGVESFDHFMSALLHTNQLCVWQRLEAAETEANTQGDLPINKV